MLDLTSQKILLKEINSILKKRACDLEASTNQFESNILEKNKIIEELKDDKKVLSGIVKRQPVEHHNLGRHTIIATVLAGCFFVLIFHVSGYLLLNHDSNIDTSLKTKYLIENLQGDTVSTWLSWRIVEGRELTINIVNSDLVSQDKIDAIKSTILDTQTTDIDDSLLGKGPVGTTSTYYLGWNGALEKVANYPTKYEIPSKLRIIDSSKGTADITITLTTLQDSDGYSGYTKSITDDR